MRPLVLIALGGLSVAAAGGCGAPSGPSPVSEQQPAPRLALRPGTAVEAPLTGGQRQAWQLPVPAGWFAALAVEQRGIDAVVILEDPAGRPLTQIDSPNGTEGPEPVVLLGAPRPLRLIVAASSPHVSPGSYAIRIEAVRPATERDRARVAAERTFARAEALRGQGDGEALRRAVGEHRRALEAFRALGDRRREADALDRLGRVYLLLGEAASAHTAYGLAVARFRELGARPSLVDALNGLGLASRSLGRPADTLACYREALEIQTGLGDRQAMGILWNNIGRLHAAQGEAGEAFRAYDRALAIWRELRNRKDEATTLANRGRLYGSLGETRKAGGSLQEAAPLLESEGHFALAAAALGDLGLIQAKSGRRQEGLATLQKALRLQERSGDRGGQAVTLNTLGWVLLQEGETRKAEEYCRRSLDLHRELGRRPDQGRVLDNLGLIAAREGRPREALALYDRALPLLAEAGDPAHEESVLFNRARAWRQLGDLQKARQNAEEALARVETLREKPGSGELRAVFLASRQEIHGFLIDLLIDLHRRQPAGGYAAEALGTSERAKARSLLDALSENGADPGDELPRILDVRDIQQEIAGSGALLLEYSLGETRSFLWAVEPGRLDVFELPPRARLETAARRAHALLSAGDRTLAERPAEEALAELAGLLLAPVRDRLAGRRLVIVPDGALVYVPFSALPFPEPLVETHEITLLPSASTLAALRRRARPALPEGSVAVIADPVFEAGDPRVSGGRPGMPARSRARGASRETALPRLPYSREEAEAILRLVPPDRRLAALDFAARRAIVTGGALAGFRIVHFATHALIDPEHPALSGLTLSRVDAQGRGQEGFLRAEEIRHLSLPADLVVLSACQTALGKEVRGEGLLGLTQSFFQAGARRVAVSLWPVDDRATAELMTRFYHAMLVEGQSPAAALRTAQISLRREPLFRSPGFWAGFVLQGDL